MAQGQRVSLCGMGMYIYMGYNPLYDSDFAAIFGDLLPGNTCRLQAPEGKEISEGLEVKVNLGGVWKQSLTELSGGQR